MDPGTDSIGMEDARDEPPPELPERDDVLALRIVIHVTILVYLPLPVKSPRNMR